MGDDGNDVDPPFENDRVSRMTPGKVLVNYLIPAVKSISISIKKVVQIGDGGHLQNLLKKI